jgi:hypothetical protein
MIDDADERVAEAARWALERLHVSSERGGSPSTGKIIG